MILNKKKRLNVFTIFDQYFFLNLKGDIPKETTTSDQTVMVSAGEWYFCVPD